MPVETDETPQSITLRNCIRRLIDAVRVDRELVQVRRDDLQVVMAVISERMGAYKQR